MMRFLQSYWFSSVLGACVYLATTFYVLIGQPKPESEPEDSAAEASASGPSWSFQNAEMDELMAELKSERDALASREVQLTELAARLKAERQEMNQITQQVHQMQVELNNQVLTLKQEEAANLKKLKSTYTAMSPDGAARILKEMDDAMVAKILMLMRDAESGPVLEAFGKMGAAEAKRAAQLSERLRLSVNSTKSKTKP